MASSHRFVTPYRFSSCLYLDTVVVFFRLFQMSVGPVPGLALNQWGVLSITWLGASTTATFNGSPISSAAQAANTVLPIGGVGVTLTGGASAQWDDLTVVTACTLVIFQRSRF